MKLLIHSQTSTDLLLEIVNGLVIHPYFIICAVTDPCWDSSYSMLVKGAPWLVKTWRHEQTWYCCIYPDSIPVPSTDWLKATVCIAATLHKLITIYAEKEKYWFNACDAWNESDKYIIKQYLNIHWRHWAVYIYIYLYIYIYIVLKMENNLEIC